jgi:nucleoside-diphosphate-sugar epimerase
MRILVTGGSGFIGIPLIRKLVLRGDEVLLFDLKPNKQSFADLSERLQIVRGDVTNADDLAGTYQKYQPDAVLHLAALISKQAEANPHLALDVNMMGTVAVFDVVSRLGGRGSKIVFPSTVATFSSDTPAPIKDDERQQPNTVYGITKVFCELWGNYCAAKYGIDFRSIRLASVIGPGRVDGGASVYASLMIENPARGLPYDVLASPDSAIPIIYIDDAVNAVLSVFDANNLTRRVYNSSGITPRASEIADQVERRVPNARITFKSDPEVVRILKQWQQMDATAFERDTGWRIDYTLDKLVSRFISSVQSNRGSSSY